MFDKTHVTVATSAILGEHIEDPTDLFEVEDGNNYLELEDNSDLESNKAPGQKTKEVEKQRAAPIAASPKKKRKRQKYPKVHEFRHMANIMAAWLVALR
ncbi:hypothetical protein ACQJBY_031718 [Aegilops geniculata]